MRPTPAYVRLMVDIDAMDEDEAESTDSESSDDMIEAEDDIDTRTEAEERSSLESLSVTDESDTDPESDSDLAKALLRRRRAAPPRAGAVERPRSPPSARANTSSTTRIALAHSSKSASDAAPGLRMPESGLESGSDCCE